MVFAAMLAVLLVTLLSGENGIIDYIELRQDLRDSQARNTRLSDRNRNLLEDVVDLKSRSDAVEEIARNGLGLIRKDEIFYRVVMEP